MRDNVEGRILRLGMRLGWCKNLGRFGYQIVGVSAELEIAEAPSSRTPFSDQPTVLENASQPQKM